MKEYFARTLAIKELLEDFPMFQIMLDEVLNSIAAVETEDDSEVKLNVLLIEDEDNDTEEIELSEELLDELTDETEVSELLSIILLVEDEE